MSERSPFEETPLDETHESLENARHTEEKSEKPSPQSEQQEHVLSREEREEIFRTTIEEGVDAAIKVVEERFEHPLDEKDRLAFHNTLHTKDVVRRFDAIMATVKQIAPASYDEHTHLVGRFGAAYHDTVQNWEPVIVPSQTPGEEGLTKIMRKRFAGINEEASTEEALAMMDKINEESGAEIFSPEDKAIIQSGHEATVPGFNPEKGTVIQPNLNEHSSLITRAIALADLGTAGMDGPEHFLPEGDALFREENLDIEEALEHPETITERQKEFFSKRMRAWSSFQEKFAAGRKALLEDELLEHFPEGAHEELRTLFGKFDDSITAAREQAAHRDTLSFEELATEMGYTLRSEDGIREVY